MQYLQEYMLIDGVHLVRRVASSKVVNYGFGVLGFWVLLLDARRRVLNIWRLVSTIE